MATSSSPRWCPTQEQVMILEEIYNKGGIKTPNALQIQQITTHLLFYGKIEGKNVFYWFQNHKARERQKLRRKFMKQLHQPCWYNHSVPSAALTPYHQGLRAVGAGRQDCSAYPQSTMWPYTSNAIAEVQRPCQHGCLLAGTLSPHSSIGQEPLKTLELFPLKSTHLNPNKQQPTSSSSSY